MQALDAFEEVWGAKYPSIVRKVLKPKGHFPSEAATMKVICLALHQASKKWTMPIRKWDLALQQLAIHFKGRVTV